MTSSLPQNGLEKIRSPRSFADTVARFESLLTAAGLTLFAKIDFTGDAQRSGLKLPPALLFLFGSPKAGTPVMQNVPDVAIDLPLKVLISESEERSEERRVGKECRCGWSRERRKKSRSVGTWRSG